MWASRPHQTWAVPAEDGAEEETWSLPSEDVRVTTKAADLLVQDS